METHGLKHHYHHNRHHHHQNQQSNHTALSKPQTFGFGSNTSITPSATIPPTKISSTAFPLLLSSIESGRQNFNSPFSHTKTNNADGLNNSSLGNSLSSNGNSKLQSFTSLGAASKHKLESNSSKNNKNCTNSGVRPTPKPKSVATPNLVSSSGRQQAAFGHGANGHSQAKSSHLTGSEVAVPLTSGLSATLPFKNNLHSRETLSNLSSSNGTHNRRLSPNKENKTATLSNSNAGSVLSGTGAKKVNSSTTTSSIRSPPTPRLSASSLACSPSGADSIPSDNARCGNHHNYNHFNDDHQNNLNAVCGIPAAAFYTSKDHDNSSNNLPNIALSNGLSGQPNNSLPKPKEFKFFKEKAKDKLKKNLTTTSNLNCDIKVSNKLQQQLKLKSKLKPNNNNNSVKPTIKKPRKSNPKSSDKCANTLPGKCKPSPPAVHNAANLSAVDSVNLCLVQLSPAPIVTNSLVSCSDIVSLQSKLEQSPQNTPVAISNNDVVVDKTSPRIVFYKEDIIDNFAFQCFFTAEDLECSLEDARLKQQSTSSSCPSVATAAAASSATTVGDPSLVPLNPGSCSSQSMPPSTVPSPALILSSNIVNPTPCPSISSTIIAPSLAVLSSPCVIFRLRSPSPPSSSSSSSSSLESDAESHVPIAKSSHSRATSSTKSSSVKSKQSNTKKSVSSQKNCPKKSAKQMPKDSSKLKKGNNSNNNNSRKKDKSFGSNDSLEQIDDEEDDEKDEEEDEQVQTSKPSKKSKKLSMIKCVHKHHKNKDACSKCLLAYKRAKLAIDKKSNNKANQINNNNNNRKKGPKGTNLAGRKSKCKTKVVNKQVNKRGRRKKVRSNSSKATKVRKSKRCNAVLNDEHHDDDDDDNEVINDDISDEDQLDEHPESEQADDEEEEADESDATQENGDVGQLDSDDSNSDNCDSDDDDGDESEDIYEDNRTIADLIKCSNRREAVRKAAARAASMAPNARNKLKSNNPACTADLSSQQSNQSGPPTQSDATETADTHCTTGGKKSKLKKLPGKLKLASNLNENNKASKRKRILTSSNKRSQFDSSSDDDDEEDDEDDSDAVNDNEEDEAEPELITARTASAAKRGRRKKSKMASVKSKCGKKSKEIVSAAAASARDNENDEVGNDGDDDADKDESQDEAPTKAKCQKRNLRSKINNNKKTKRKVTKHDSKTASKTNRKKAPDASEEEAEQEEEMEDEENDDNATDDQEDDQHVDADATTAVVATAERQLTEDSEMDDEQEQSSSDEEHNLQAVKKSKSKANNSSSNINNNNNSNNNNNNTNNKKVVTPKKVAKVAPNRKQKQTPTKTKSQEKNKSDKPRKTTKKSEKAKQETNKKCSDSEEETEKSEEDENNSDHYKDDAESDAAGQTQPQSKVHQQQKNKCDKLKAKAIHELNDKSNSDSNNGQVKDVYTFELSPGEVPSTTTRFVLSSGQDSKSRIDCTKSEISQQETIVCTAAGASTPVTCTSTTAISSSQMSMKSSFSPKSHTSNQEYPVAPAVYEPLRPDNYPHYESSFGPNASLSSLSQLSQSIGGGGCGPILLNHQSPNSKCSVNIKEEPKEDSTTVRSPFANQKVSLHRTPPPTAVSDHLSASQNYAANFASVKNGNSNRLWSNASAGSLISSSSSSSSSPVHLAFGQCPPTPATPASLASYFTPSNSLPGFSSSVYQPSQGQDLIRRDLDSRILASSVHDRSLLPPTLCIPSTASTMKPIATVPHFNHVPSSPLINTTSSSSSFITSSTSSPILSQNSAPIYPIIPSMASSGYLSGMNPIIKPITPLKLGSSPSLNPSPVITPSVPLSRPPSASSSHSSSSRSKTQLANVKQGSWSSMHVRIAWDIYHKQKAKQQQQQQQVLSESANRITTPTSTSHHISSTPKTSSHKSSKSSSSSNSNSSNSNSIPVEQSTNYLTSNSTQSPSIKNSFDSLNGQSSSLRPASAMSFPTTYPRYGTPFNASSMSAPPVLPGLFPPTIPASMHMPGFIPESWPRQPFPGSMPASITPNRPPPYLYPEFYDSSNSASSALSAWAASIRPPGDFLIPGKQATAPSPSVPEPPKHVSSISANSSSQKRKHDELESKSKDRTSSHKSHNSTAYQNGDIRSEHSSKRSHSTSSKYSKTDYSHQQSPNCNNNSNTIFENSHKNRSRTDQSNVSHVKKSESLKNEAKNNYNSLNSTSSTITSPSFPGPMFSSHPSFPTSEHQHSYIDLFGIPQSSSLVPTSSYIDALNNADLSSRPLWSFGMPPTSASPGMPLSIGHSSSMMADPFKSLQDISLRPGLVTPDRDALFSRYSLLNSSGGGASIFDKFSKEQLEKYEMMQNHGKHSRASPTVNTSKSSALPDLSNPSSSSMSSNSLSSRLSSLPPTSIPSGVPPPPSSPFPYPQSYLNPLHHLGASSSSYLAHSPFLNSATNSMLNGGSDSISKMTFGAPLPPGLPTVNECPPPSSQFLFPPHYPPGAPPGMMNFLKASHHASASANYNSAR